MNPVFEGNATAKLNSCHKSNDEGIYFQRTIENDKIEWISMSEKLQNC